MRVLIVMIREVEMATYQLPMGIGYVSGSLKRAGHDVRVLNPNHSTEEIAPLLARAIADHSPELVAVGGMSFHMSRLIKLVRMARSYSSGAPIVVGGVGVTNHPELTMRALPEADIGVIGEGEQTAVELVDALASGSPLAAVKGIIYRSGDELVQTAPRPMETDLNSLPWVDWEGVGLDVYAGLHRPGQLAPGLIVEHNARAMPFLTSRGCPFSCTFCCHDILGKRYRTRSLDDVFAELEYAIDRFGINTVSILDDLFCLKRERIREFCERIRPLDLRWECSLRVEQVNAEDLAVMRDSGCVTISIGVESMSQTVLDSMQKKTKTEALENALNLMYEAKLATWSNLIYGDPAETMETATESLEWAAEHNRFDLRPAFIGYHPGSKIYNDAVEKGLIKDPLAFLLSDRPEINGTTMTDREYRALQSEIVPRYTKSFGFPGRIKALTTSGHGSAIDLVCSHCGADLHYEQIHLNPRIINRISCKACNQLQRLPVRFRPAPSPELRQLYSRLEELLSARAINRTPELDAEVFQLCKQINDIDSGNDLVWLLMIEILDNQEREEDVLRILELAIVANPYNPKLFDQMDVRLRKLGRTEEGAKYARQAQLLRRTGVTAPNDILVTYS